MVESGAGEAHRWENERAEMGLAGHGGDEKDYGKDNAEFEGPRGRRWA